MTTRSEVAALRATIEQEYNAAHEALHGLAAGTARHAVISARMGRAQQASEELIEAIGTKEALPIIIAAMEGKKSS